MVKYVKDYYEELYEKFPMLNKKEIQKIVNYGWRQVYLINSYGGDLCITDQNFWCFFGRLTKDSIKHFDTYIRKLTVKLRVLYKRTKQKWDGYYYFALTDRQYEALNLKKMGRPKKHLNYGNQILYKILDECKLRNFHRRYIYRVPFLINGNLTYYAPNFKTDKAELIEVREPQKFKDILTSNYDYKFI